MASKKSENFKLLLLVFFPVVLSLTPGSTAAQFILKPGDHICLVGNALGERMQHHNFFETMLHSNFPNHNLVVRNLCFPGDEPLQRERSENFGEPDMHLTHSKASVVMFFFGFNESFGGKLGRSRFAAEMKTLIKETQGKKYDGKSSPRIVVVSPIAFENTGDPNLPDGKSQNGNLALYTAELQKLCEETKVTFVDLFHPTKQLFEVTQQRLTLNGAHLNAAGYRELAPILFKALTGNIASGKANVNLKKEIDDKNFHWWHRYRAVNGFSIYGKRGLAGKDGSNTYNNRDVMERERVILDQMTANRDRRIWSLARNESTSDKADDSNTSPFFEPTTNVGGKDDVNRKRGKLGSLDYLTADDQQKLFRLPPGYKISVVATEEEIPELANPVAINFDKHGRLWVATMPSYPHWKPKTVMNDKLIILEDVDKNGRMDKCHVFADRLHQPTGFEIGFGGAFVAQQPDILFIKDIDGDDVADTRIRKLVGFDTADSHHGIAAFEWGPGGGLYFQEGTFKFSQVESPYGLTRMSEAGIWRYDPRTEKFEAHVSLAFANPWGHVFDKFGQNFVADASPGFNYWATPISGHVVHPDKHTGGSQYRRINPGRLRTQGDYPRFLVKRTRPSSGCEFLISSHFPPEFQNNFLVNNVIGERCVLNHRMTDDGSGFGGTEAEKLVFCEDGNFRPVDLQIGPDGALYICDWHNALIGHLQHNLRDPSRDHSHGRIWKITYEGRQLLNPPNIADASTEELLKLLSVYEDRTRYRVKIELASRETQEVISAVTNWVKGLDKNAPDYERMLLEALWQHQSHNLVEEVLLSRVMDSPDFRVRAAATRVASFWRDQLKNPLATISRSIHDEHPRVRLEAVRACSFILSSDSLELALDILKYKMDKWLDYTLEETVRTLTTQIANHRKMPHKSAAETPPTKNPDAHDHHVMGNEPIVFLNKDRKIVRFQLDRLSDAELLAIVPQPENPNYSLVALNILTRPNTPIKQRQRALNDYSRLSDLNLFKTVLTAMEFASDSNAKTKIALLLANQPTGILKAIRKEILNEFSKSPDSILLSGMMAALIRSGHSADATALLGSSAEKTTAFLKGITFIDAPEIRNSMRENVVQYLSAGSPFSGKSATTVRKAAIDALGLITTRQQENFVLLSPFIDRKPLRKHVVKALLNIPLSQRSLSASKVLAQKLLNLSEATPAKERTSNDFLNAAELTSQLLVAFAPGESKKMRERLRSVSVRVIRIHTVEEEMRYDKPYFAVEAGRPVQVILINDDLMPHNLVLTAPGSLREVADLAGTLGPSEGVAGKQYVPRSSKVLQATSMVPARGSEAITFQAPSTPGEYPFVCTFPRHWMRMYGVMIVVEDLDAWQKNPVPPKDPIGSNRSFVKKWKTDDFKGKLSSKFREPSQEVGRKLFQEGACAQCHKLAGQGGAVGPDLSAVFDRNKNDREAILREILDPSAKIAAKYEVYLIQTFDGLTMSGIVTAQDQNQITLIANPENPKPITISKDNIEAIKKTSSSLMPKALLDNFQMDEIIELLNYIESNQK